MSDRGERAGRSGVGPVLAGPEHDASASSVQSVRGLQLALRGGAAIWLILLMVGFFAPGGWTWGMAGPLGHIENYMISLWAVGLVFAPLLASRHPRTQTAAVQVYLLAVLAICLSTFRGEALKWIADGPPLIVAAACLVAVVACHPDRASLLQW